MMGHFFLFLHWEHWRKFSSFFSQFPLISSLYHINSEACFKNSANAMAEKKPCSKDVCVYVCVEISEPLQRPCETKWLQWIKSERDLWINRGRLLVDWSDRQIDEPLPTEIGSWFALCIPSIPQSLGGKCRLSMLLIGGGRRKGAHTFSTMPPACLTCPFVSITRIENQFAKHPTF